MAERKISTHDLARLVEIEKEMAQMHQKYIKMGFSASDIAETFATIYFREFSETLDEDGLNCLKRELSIYNQTCGSGEVAEATGRMCIRMASGFLKAVTRKLSESKPSCL